jgi:hypothetical protein
MHLILTVALKIMHFVTLNFFLFVDEADAVSVKFTDFLQISGDHFFKSKMSVAVTILTVRGILLDTLQIKEQYFISA